MSTVQNTVYNSCTSTSKKISDRIDMTKPHKNEKEPFLVKVERYASSFRYSGDHVDKKSLDCVRRKKTRIIAIDALCIPGMRQYKAECLLREINKAFCGFYDQSKCQRYMNISQEDHIRPDCHDVATEGLNNEGQNNPTLRESASAVEKSNEGANQAEMIGNCLSEPFGQSLHPEYEVGIVTGNWGCGAFGGDPEIKTIIQWLAASQALRPFILYHTFEEESLQSLEQVSNWILTHEWTVGELWNMLAVYSSQRLKNETSVGFLNWLVPSFSFQSNEMSDPDFMEE
ncbi:hypothetical protein GIB67_031801 [Kingdonia uniflora]|uniref:PARG catalytic Macro domain-containing protein n=1 Tax=Kingdonia uniflora TaxID=39325 RepID=A0A7J7L4M3_9MAGN|nr:hypothetical protein GIB67_031801 [Kingdonia uniflora]